MKLIYFLLFFLLKLSKQDLPVHCLKSEIIGVWTIKATNLKSVRTGHEMTCGHEEPSSEDSSVSAKSTSPLENEYQLILKEDDIAILTMDNTSLEGKWTMVYDEGFDLKFKEYSFLAFSKYTIVDLVNNFKMYKSHCFSTLTGWYSSANKTLRGCYQAVKVGVDPMKVTNANTKKGKNIIIEQSSNTVNIPTFLETKTDINSDTIEYIDKINKNVKKSWTAGIHVDFFKKSFKDLNKYAGLFRFKSQTRFPVLPLIQVHDKLPVKEEQFPINFDWKHILKPAMNQGDCGSCYTIATLRMLEARLKILYNHDVNLSVQHALSCSYYNQGCNGGYPYLVMKFGNDFELVPETCQPYMAIINIMFRP